MFIKRKKRNTIGTLFPLVRKVNPRRCGITGETEKHQTPYPGPWMNEHKNFNNPRKFPLEIDHINMEEHMAKEWNLRWLTKLAHIETTKMHLFPYRRRRIKRAPTRKSGNFFSWE